MQPVPCLPYESESIEVDAEYEPIIGFPVDHLPAWLRHRYQKAALRPAKRYRGNAQRLTYENDQWPDHHRRDIIQKQESPVTREPIRASKRNSRPLLKSAAKCASCWKPPVGIIIATMVIMPPSRKQHSNRLPLPLRQGCRTHELANYDHGSRAPWHATPDVSYEFLR